MIDYLTLAEVQEMHTALIDRYGGSHGVRDLGAVEAALYRPQSGYYEDIFQQAAALMESLVMNHPFIDGNKRIAFAATDVFLRINGYVIQQSSEDIYAFLIELLENNQLEMAILEKWLRKVVKKYK